MEKIVEALKALDVENDAHWTSDGQPKVEYMRMISGVPSLTRADIEAVAPEFKRSNPVVKAAAPVEPKPEPMPELQQEVPDTETEEVAPAPKQTVALTVSVKAVLSDGLKAVLGDLHIPDDGLDQFTDEELDDLIAQGNSAAHEIASFKVELDKLIAQVHSKVDGCIREKESRKPKFRSTQVTRAYLQSQAKQNFAPTKQREQFLNPVDDPRTHQRRR